MEMLSFVYAWQLAHKIMPMIIRANSAKKERNSKADKEMITAV